MKKTLNYKAYAETIREAVSEGIVLLKNENNALPVKNGEKISVFGRIQLNYYSCGTGSGGMVNAPYEVSIIDGIRNSGVASINEELYDIYKAWEMEHPFDTGVGWASEPFSQEEMPVTVQMVKKAKDQSDLAVVIIGRSAGEDRDVKNEKGSYLLTDEEEKLLSTVCSVFERSIVLLNVGAIMDMKWVMKYNPSAVLYVWQGGQEGGNGVADVICGKVNPSGRLVDTIAYDLKDYPSWMNFGNKFKNLYQEDIYVGYRYFETIAHERTMYPFGYGLSYTTFDIDVLRFEGNEEEIRIFIYVTNTGNVAGKEVVQVYYNPPSVHLGKPLRNLIRFGKTGLLQPGESTKMAIAIRLDEMASYDDNGLTGHRSCYVLEAGAYQIYLGRNVRDAFYAGQVELQDLVVTKQLHEAMAPVEPFTRMVYDGKNMTYEPVMTRQKDLSKWIERNRPKEITYTGDKGYKLSDVLLDKVHINDFIAQLSDDDLIEIGRMEGMCSPKVTGGTAGAIGGVTERLQNFGIPILACSDGPAGIRRDDGSMAFLIPSGTLLACTFNTELVERLFDFLGCELCINDIITILGPGMNIHRHPLNGRNFEYFSEDPYVTGAMAAAEIAGLQKHGVTGTLKHFCGNNQETARNDADAVVSERALREIYLKGFEMAVKNAGAKSIMSSYNPVNGSWTPGNYDLMTTILRMEWGFEGVVMTDWWTKSADELTGNKREEASVTNQGPLVRAQCDLYAVASSASENTNNDNRREWLDKGLITRGELQRNATNICSIILRAEKLAIMAGIKKPIEWEEIEKPQRDMSQVHDMGAVVIDTVNPTILPIDGFKSEAGSHDCYRLIFSEKGDYNISFRMRSTIGGVAQMNGAVTINQTPFASFSLSGADTEWTEKVCPLPIVVSVENYVDIYFSQSGIEVSEIIVTPPKEFLKQSGPYVVD